VSLNHLVYFNIFGALIKIWNLRKFEYHLYCQDKEMLVLIGKIQIQS
jgi:hypothetical protein